MNQLLVSGKVYMTPELKKKKIAYKGYLLLSVFVVCILVSYYIYGMYQGMQDELLAQEILGSIVAGSPEDTTMAPTVNDAIVVYLDNESQEIGYGEEIELEPVPLEPEAVVEEEQAPEYTPISSKYKAKNGKTYDIVGIIEIPEIKLEYPILSKTTDALLKISVCKFWGPEPNEVGNFCVAGHNYTNTRAFSKAYKLEKGDFIYITDLSGRKVKYEIYSHYVVKANNTEPTSQITHGQKEVTLITCTNGVKERRIIKALEVQEEV